jgi:hypothetical protein
MMGPFVISIPKKVYPNNSNASATDNTLPVTSKLLNSSYNSNDIENDIMANQLSQRLAQQLQMSIFVSCNLPDFNNNSNTNIQQPSSVEIDPYNDISSSTLNLSNIERQSLRHTTISIAVDTICNCIQNYHLQQQQSINQ